MRLQAEQRVIPTPRNHLKATLRFRKAGGSESPYMLPPRSLPIDNPGDRKKLQMLGNGLPRDVKVPRKR